MSLIASENHCVWATVGPLRVHLSEIKKPVRRFERFATWLLRILSSPLLLVKQSYNCTPLRLSPPRYRICHSTKNYWNPIRALYISRSFQMRLSLFLLFCLTGCATAEFARKDYDPKGGVISVTGNAGQEQALEDAHDMMEDHCAPRGYRIISEGNGRIQTGAQVNQIGNTFYATPTTKEQTNITFRCR